MIVIANVPTTKKVVLFFGGSSRPTKRPFPPAPWLKTSIRLWIVLLLSFNYIILRTEVCMYETWNNFYRSVAARRDDRTSRFADAFRSATVAGPPPVPMTNVERRTRHTNRPSHPGPESESRGVGRPHAAKQTTSELVARSARNVIKSF